MQELLTNTFFIQAIGFVAFGFGIAAFLSRNDRWLKKLLILQGVFLASHYYLLGVSAAPFITVISVLRNIASLFGKMQKAAPVFIAAYVALGVYRYETWVDVLPTISTVVSTYGLFYLKGIRMRFCFLFSTSLWILHNFIVVSIGPFFMEVFIFSSNLFTILSLVGIIKVRKR